MHISGCSGAISIPVAISISVLMSISLLPLFWDITLYHIITNLSILNLFWRGVCLDFGYTARGDVPRSADDYLQDKRNLILTILACIFTGLLTISIAVTLTTDISLARVIYTVFKLTILLYRMAKGYARGAKAYNTIEVRRFKAICNYLRQYIKFIEDKIYLKLGDKYGDISQFVAEDIEYVEYTEDEATAKVGFV